METITKQTREVGTSAGVLLPRSWLNKQVVVTLFEPSLESIAKDVMGYLFSNHLNEDVKGIYLFGSYSRGDFDFNSDIDILVVTHDKNKIVHYSNYEIILVSERAFLKNLPENLNYLSFLKEAKVIFNRELLQRYKGIRYALNFKKNLLEIKGVLKINQDTVDTCRENQMKVPDGVVYSIVLRLRELYLIRCLISDKPYSKEKFLDVVGEKVYSPYIRIKRNEKELNNTLPEDLNKLLDLSEKWLKELKD